MATCHDVDQLFDPAFLRRLDALSLAARQLVRGRMKADRRSVQHGASVEFAEYRSFVEGDDFRYIDWNAFARWRQLVMKLFVEEEDLHVHILLDASRSMDWGTPNKFDYARQTAAGLAYLAMGNLDRVGLAFVGEKDYTSWPISRGKERFLPLLRFLARNEVVRAPLSLENAVAKWLATKPKRGLVICISDFWGNDPGDAFKALDRLRYARHEIALIQITDLSEGKAGELGEYELLDADYGERLKVILDPRTIREYRQSFLAYQERLHLFCRRSNISLLQAETSLPVEELLLKSLRQGGFVR